MRRAPVGILATLFAAACSFGPVASVPYVTPPPSSDDATGFGGMRRALAVLHAGEAARGRREKPAASPIGLTTSDGNGLVLAALTARGVIDGPLAVTELHLVFDNPEDRQREGRFQIALPDGAAVSRLAMTVGTRWMESEVVPRPRAREVYETYLRPMPKDPALLERAAGNVFTARIFPIQPKERKELIITYSQPVSAAHPYRLHLAGLPAIDALDVAVAGGARSIAYAKAGETPDDVVVDVGGVDAVVAGDAAVIRIAPALETPAEPLAAATILVDTSASRGGELRAQAELVRDLVLALERQGLVEVEIAAFDQTVAPLVRGTPTEAAATIVEAVLARGALGASDLSGALAWAGARGRRVIVIGDGISTAGAFDLAEVRAAAKGAPRVDAIVLGGRGDREALLAAVGGGEHGGVVIDDARGVDTDEWAARLGRGVLARADVIVEGARWVWPERLESVQPGDDVVIVARLETASDPAARRALGVRVGGTRVEVPARAANAVLVERTVVAAEIARRRRALAGLEPKARDAERGALAELAVANRLLTDETGMLVLESDAEYAMWCLDRTALADILAVDDGAIDVITRRGDVVPKYGCPTPAEAGLDPALGGNAITGVVRDDRTGELLPGATVVATRSGDGERHEAVAITDDRGRYAITGLPAGTYDITFYFGDLEVRRSGVVVAGADKPQGSGTIDAPAVMEPTIAAPPALATSGGGRGGGGGGDGVAAIHDGGSTTSVSMRLESRQAAELILISDSAPMIDPTTTSTGLVITNPTSFGIGRFGTSRSGGGWGGGWGGCCDEPWRGDPPKGGKPAWSGRYAQHMAIVRSGDAEGAVADALAWIGEAPSDLLAVLALGDALEARGMGPLAARAYGSILDLFPDRAELMRAAGQRLLRAGDLERAITAFRRAVADRPKQATGQRMLAWALVRAGDLDGALAAIEVALEHAEWDARDVYRADFAMIAQAIRTKTPGRTGELARRADDAGATIDTRARVRFVLTWETDASDLDLHVIDRRHGRAWSEHKALGRVKDAVKTTAFAGWGPEEIALDLDDARLAPYTLQAYVTDIGPQGHTLGALQIVEADGAGGFTFTDRPFVVTENNAYVDLGDWE
jgi:hypothetical protein